VAAEAPAWAYTALRPRLFRLDARAVFPLGLWILHWSWPTLWAAMAGLALLTLMDWMGFTPETALERFRAVLAGKIRPATDVLAMRRRAMW
jgi:intracellular multiplication protein IcmT